jgi:hypothetical protein
MLISFIPTLRHILLFFFSAQHCEGITNTSIYPRTQASRLVFCMPRDRLWFVVSRSEVLMALFEVRWPWSSYCRFAAVFVLL